ncbi:MAG: sulfatase [bacterium]|nr:sulfatase [bacterium]
MPNNGRTGFLSGLTLALRAGSLGGIFASFLEILYITHLGAQPSQFSALFFAAASYGIIGGIFGFFTFIIVQLIRKPAVRPESNWSTGLYFFTIALLSTTYFIGQFYVFRYYHHEMVRHTELKGLVTMFMLLLVTIPFYFLFKWVFTRFLSRQLSWILKPVGYFTVVPVILILGFILQSSFSTDAESVHTPFNPSAQINVQDKPYVIFIVVDTFRADALGCYGNSAAHTPNLDALARDGVLFKQEYSQASHTKPSTASLISSRFPTEHQAIYKTSSLPSSVTTVAEVLADGGYYCGGIIVNVNLAPVYNFNQGFHEYTYLAPDFFLHANHAASRLVIHILLNKYHWGFQKKFDVSEFYSNAEEVYKNTENFLTRNRGNKYFLFLHFMDPHDPYFEHPYTGKCYPSAILTNPDISYLEPFKDFYQQEVDYVDSWLGKLFSDLKAAGTYDSTLIVLTSDHGEEFHEHGGWWHGYTLHTEAIHVPLIIKKPFDQDAGRIVDEPTSGIDVVPTILGTVGLERPAEMRGRDLFDTTMTSMPDSIIFSEADFMGNKVQMIRIGDWKYIETNPENPSRRPPQQLFNLKDDPSEQHNLVDSLPTKLAEMQLLLKEKYHIIQSTKETAVEGQLDDATKDRLRALGYVQ